MDNRNAQPEMNVEQLKTVNLECADHLANATDDCISEMRRANRAEAEIERLRGLLTEVANSGVEASGISRYLKIQISDVTWAELGEWRSS